MKLEGFFGKRESSNKGRKVSVLVERCPHGRCPFVCSRFQEPRKQRSLTYPSSQRDTYRGDKEILIV